MSERDFKGVWVPKEIWFSKELSPIEKLLYIEIDSLDNKFGCTALNKHFSVFLGVSTKRVSELINGLVKKGFITSQLVYKPNSKEIDGRILHSKMLVNPKGKDTPPKNVSTSPEKNGYPIPENVKDSKALSREAYEDSIDNSIPNISEIPLGINKCSNSQNLNERFSPNGKGNDKGSYENTYEIGEYTGNMEVSYVMAAYDSTYRKHKGCWHPKIKASQLECLNDTLATYIDEFLLKADDMLKMIDYFFAHPPKNCDMNVNVFLTRSVFVRVGYSTNVITGYVDMNG